MVDDDKSFTSLIGPVLRELPLEQQIMVRMLFRKRFSIGFSFPMEKQHPFFFHLEKYFEIDFFLEISMENFHVFFMENTLFDQVPLLFVLIHGFLALIKLFFPEIMSILVLVSIWTLLQNDHCAWKRSCAWNHSISHDSNCVFLISHNSNCFYSFIPIDLKINIEKKATKKEY